MIIPSTRVFSAGEVETGAYLNSAVTNLGNFMLGKPICSMYSTSTQSFASGTDAAVTPWTEVVDRDNGHDTITNPSRYTFQTAGYYWIAGGANFTSTTATYRGTYFRLNGSTAIQGTSSFLSVASVGFASTSCALAYFSVGDYIELMGRVQTTATTLVAPPAGSTATAWFDVVWVSA